MFGGAHTLKIGPSSSGSGDASSFGTPVTRLRLSVSAWGLQFRVRGSRHRAWGLELRA